MDLCSLNPEGEIVLHRTMKAAPEPLLKAMAPSREDLVVAVDGIVTWSWLADLGAQAQRPVGLGHAVSMQAIHGGKAKHDTIDAQNIAVLRRGGMLPQAYVSPAERRATRALLRRRFHLTRQRAELLAHVQQTTSQYNRPAIGKPLADQANRDGVAARCPAPAVQKRVEGDLALMDSEDPRRRDVEVTLGQTATQHQAQALSRRPSVPGSGKMLRVVLREEMHAISRFPRGQACVSSGRLGTGAQASAGQRDGTAGAQLGTASLQWAFSQAAVLGLRNTPAGPKDRARLEHHHGQGTALPV